MSTTEAQSKSDAELLITAALWWLAPKKDESDPNGAKLARTMTQVATDRETANMPRRWNSYRFFRCMTGRPQFASFAYAMARRPSNFMSFYGQAEFQPMKAGFSGGLGDVYVNRLFAHTTFVEFVPEKGDFTQRQLAEELTPWCEDEFETSGFWEAYGQMGLDALYYGTGFIKFCKGLKKHGKCESTNPDELLFANEDEPNPQEVIQRVWTTKEDALTKHGKTQEARDAIMKAQSAYPAFYFGPGTLNTENIIALLEGWSLPNSKGEPGRHVLCIGEYTLVDEPWTDPELPFERFAFHELPSSIYGQGLAELTLQFSEWIDEILQTMQESDIRSGTGKWLLEENSNVNVDALGDTNAAAVTYLGKEPKFITPDPINRYALDRLQMLVDMGMKRVHVSVNAVTGEVPKALTSAIAVERWAQIDDANFAEMIGRLEKVVVRSSYQLLRLAKRQKPSTKRPGRDKQIIDWDRLQIDGDRPIMMDGFNVGRLGQTVAGKTQQLEKMVADGGITRQVYNKYLQVPDIDNLMDEINAPVEGVSRMLENLIMGGKYIPPSPFFDLGYAKQAVEARIILEGNEGTPEDVLDRLRMWRSAVIALKIQQTTPDAAPGPVNAAATGITPPTTAPGAPTGTAGGIPGPQIPIPQPQLSQ